MIAEYREQQLRLLLDHVRDGFAKMDAGEIDPFDLDELIHHYKRPAGGQSSGSTRSRSSKAASAFASSGSCWQGRNCIARSSWSTGGARGRVRHCLRSIRSDDPCRIRWGHRRRGAGTDRLAAGGADLAPDTLYERIRIGLWPDEPPPPMDVAAGPAVLSRGGPQNRARIMAAAQSVAGFWGAAASDAGRTFSHDRVVRALSLLPDVGIWAISEDSSALFALVADEVVFTVGFRDDGTVGVHSRPLDSKRLLVSHTWGESKPIEAGGTAWSTRCVFTYRAEREARDAWQHITGSVVLDRVRGERLDQREKFARAIASTAGWNVSD